MDIHFSYLATRVDNASLNQVDRDGRRILVGRYRDSQHDVFEEYRRARRRHSTEAPHLQFANCSSDDESIQRFTASWGVLGFALPWQGGLAAIMAEGPIGDPAIQFEFALDDWRQLQARFVKMLALAKSRRSADRKELAAEIQRFGGPLLGNQVRLSPKFVVARSGELAFRIDPNDLWSALCMMLLCDLSAHGSVIKQCADPNCANFFPSERSNKKFCDAVCAQRFHKRKWFRIHGRERKKRQRRGSQNVKNQVVQPI
jgi:hypothetical protein